MHCTTVAGYLSDKIHSSRTFFLIPFACPVRLPFTGSATNSFDRRLSDGGRALACALDPGKSPTQYSHRIWGPEEGLLQPSIYAILQSRDGFIWLGTQDGLIRFDGMRFRDFTVSGQTPFRKTLVRAVAEDTRQDLWIGDDWRGSGGFFQRRTPGQILDSKWLPQQ